MSDNSNSSTETQSHSTTNKKLDIQEILVLVSSCTILIAAAVFWYLQIADVKELLDSVYG